MGQVRLQWGLGYGGIWKSTAAANYELLILYDHNDGEFDASPPEQNGRDSGRRHFQMHFLQWKW